MLLNEKKLMVVEVVYDSYVSQSGIEDIIIKPVNSYTDSVSIIRELIKSDSNILKELLNNNDFVQALSSQGFVNKERIKDLDSKVQLEKEFYLKNGCNITKMDLTDEEDLTYVARTLTYPGAMLLQTVSPKSLQKLNNKAYKMYIKEKRIMEEMHQKEAEKKAKAKARRLARQIEKAKLILKEAEEKKEV